nr:major capsid protein [uncultured Holophaga sp.]
MAKKPFVADPYLTGITTAFRNPSTALIADLVLPRVKVGKEEFGYNTFPTEDAFTLPDTRVGRTSKVNQVEFSAARVTSQTNDYGLEDPIPYKDIDNAQGSGYDPEARATEVLTDLILLDREVRAANAVFSLDSYASSNRTTLTGVSQWSDTTNSDPVTALETARDAMLLAPNMLVLGKAVWTALAKHPAVVEACLGSASTKGRVTRQMLADVLEIPQIIVGEGWVNTARKGQTASMARAWGKHAAMLYVNPVADTERGITFGITAQFGDRVAGRREDPEIGLDGGTVIRVGERVKELVIANTTGYFFKNAIA